MGDHRAKISISMEFHGKTYEWKDAWINYDGFRGPDPRVIEFFEKSWEDGIARYNDENYLHQERQRASQTRHDELAELRRLKIKYETD